MFRKMTIGLAAVAATTAVALSLPATAQADSSSQAERWGPVRSAGHLAKADGRVAVEWDDQGESNEITVRGRLYDLDERAYDDGGKCAYVRFEAADFDHEWSRVYSRKYCGFPGSKRFGFEEQDVFSLRAQVCQIAPRGGFPRKCGPWVYLYTAESE
ncbi:hypothetical protein FAF44_28050 [Nonomuraea sp. MG754425]|uniref:hypothetical protein n=1 Tax=Nonomuraea sp. MG754425 TaxID=2570319 RepID=UPI001F208DC0|nr:hypothetical protein [Nonomuraea sp. MG754425]MCF6472217.1 hypothetical protein [Nonomuraea sp. MG754425]